MGIIILKILISLAATFIIFKVGKKVGLNQGKQQILDENMIRSKHHNHQQSSFNEIFKIIIAESEVYTQKHSQINHVRKQHLEIEDSTSVNH